MPGSSSCSVTCKVSWEMPSALTKTILGGVVSRTQTPFHAGTSHACLDVFGGTTAMSSYKLMYNFDY